MKKKIATQMEAIGDNDLCVSAYHTGTIYRSDRNMKVTHPSCQLEYLLFYDSTPGHSMLIRKDFIRRIFQEWDGHILYDWWIAVNAHLNHGLTCVDQPLNWHRPHEGSAIHQLNRKYGAHIRQNPTWEPYIYGFRDYRRQQRLETWQFFYGYICRKTAGQPRLALSHRLSRLLTRKDPVSLFRLCLTCMLHKQTIYYNPRQKGLISWVRAFFYPMIRAYGNTYFRL